MLNRAYESDLRTSLHVEALSQGAAVATDYARTAIADVMAKRPPPFRWPDAS